MNDVTVNVKIGAGLHLALSAKDENGDPADLTGYAVYGGVKSSPSDDDYVLDLDPTITTPASGVITITQDTSSVPSGTYGWDVFAVKTGELPLQLVEGVMKFRKPITNLP